MVSEALQAAEILTKDNIQARIINMHTIKPIDQQAIIKSAQKTGAVVTAEEHQINGGLGSAVAEVLAKNFPVPVEMVAVQDRFGESGEPEELLKKYHLKDIDIVHAVKKTLSRKKRS
jgi:transketolase